MRAGIAAPLIAVAVTVSGCGGHSKSWEYGYNHTGDAVPMTWTGASYESGCNVVSTQGKVIFVGDIYDQAEAIEGCMAGLAGK